MANGFYNEEIQDAFDRLTRAGYQPRGGAYRGKPRSRGAVDLAKPTTAERLRYGMSHGAARGSSARPELEVTFPGGRSPAQERTAVATEAATTDKKKPFYVRHPRLAGMIMALVGGQQGAAQAGRAQEKYRTEQERKAKEKKGEEEKRAKEEQESSRQRDIMAEKTGEPSMAATTGMFDTLQARRARREGAVIPEGYAKHPFKEGEIVASRTPGAEKDFTLRPGGARYDAEGNLIVQRPGKTKEERERDLPASFFNNMNKLDQQVGDYGLELQRFKGEMETLNHKINTGAIDPDAPSDPDPAFTNRQYLESLRRGAEASQSAIDQTNANIREMRAHYGLEARQPKEAVEEPQGPREFTDSDWEDFLSAASPEDRKILEKATPRERQFIMKEHYIGTR
jgi:hypothetical protein